MNPMTTDLHVPSETRLSDFHPLGDGEDDYSVVEADVATVTTTAEPSPQQALPDVDLSQAALTDEQRQKLEALLLTYSDVFSAHDQDYGRTNLVQHSINTADARPIKQRAYRTSPNIRAEIDRQVQQLLAQDIIEDSCSPWSSPVVPVTES